MKAAVREVSPEFANELVPQCRHLLWCPEGKRCCGAAPTKVQLVEILATTKEDYHECN